MKAEKSSEYEKRMLADVEFQYLNGVDAYKEEKYNEAISYFEKALNMLKTLQLDSNTKERIRNKIETGLGRAKMKLEGKTPVPVVMPADVKVPYTKGVEAYLKENYTEAISYFEKALNVLETLQLDSDTKEEIRNKIETNLGKAKNMAGVKQPKVGGKPEVKKPKKVNAGQPPKKQEQPEEHFKLFKHVGHYGVYIDLDNENIKNLNKREGPGKTNIPETRSHFGKGEQTDWEKKIYDIIDSYGGVYIGSVVDSQGMTTSVFFCVPANDKPPELYKLEWKIRNLPADSMSTHHERVEFITTKVGTDSGLSFREIEEPPQLTKLKEDFKKAGIA